MKDSPHRLASAPEGRLEKADDDTLSLSAHAAGVSLNPIIVYCASQEEMDLWFGLLKENIEANGGTAIAPTNYTRVKVAYRTFQMSRDAALTLSFYRQFSQDL